MIRTFLGKPGSGKTLMAVKEMFMNPEIKYYTNISTKLLKNVINLKKDNLVKRTLLKTKKNGEKVFNDEFNKEYWINLKKEGDMINIVIDEIHNIYDARRSMSKSTKIVNDFIALIRKILSDSSAMRTGTLTMITQLDRRLDIIGLEMSNQLRYHIAEYDKKCLTCGNTWHENNEHPLPREKCMNCGSIRINKTNLTIYSYYFDSLPALMFWKERGSKTYFHRTKTIDAEFYFNKYNTMQWEDLLDL